MENNGFKNFGDLFVLMLSRNSLQLTFAVAWTASVIALWNLAPVFFH